MKKYLIAGTRIYGILIALFGLYLSWRGELAGLVLVTLNILIQIALNIESKFNGHN